MTDYALLPEHVGCPQCGSTEGKRWRSYSGVELCTDCEWDYFGELNTRKLLDARSQLREPRLRPIRARGGSEIRATSLTPSRPGANPATTQDWHRRGSPSRLPLPPSPRPEDDIRCRVKYREVLDKLVTPGFNSLCLLCSRIFYGARLERCSRCGGLCQQVSDHDLGLMGRHGQRLVEQER